MKSYFTFSALLLASFSISSPTPFLFSETVTYSDQHGFVNLTPDKLGNGNNVSTKALQNFRNRKSIVAEPEIHKLFQVQTVLKEYFFNNFNKKFKPLSSNIMEFQVNVNYNNKIFYQNDIIFKRTIYKPLEYQLKIEYSDKLASDWLQENKNKVINTIIDKVFVINNNRIITFIELSNHDKLPSNFQEETISRGGLANNERNYYFERNYCFEVKRSDKVFRGKLKVINNQIIDETCLADKLANNTRKFHVTVRCTRNIFDQRSIPKSLEYQIKIGYPDKLPSDWRQDDNEVIKAITDKIDLYNKTEMKIESINIEPLDLPLPIDSLRTRSSLADDTISYDVTLKSSDKCFSGKFNTIDKTCLDNNITSRKFEDIKNQIINKAAWLASNITSRKFEVIKNQIIDKVCLADEKMDYSWYPKGLILRILGGRIRPESIELLYNCTILRVEEISTDTPEIVVMKGIAYHGDIKKVFFSWRMEFRKNIFDKIFNCEPIIVSKERRGYIEI